MSSIRSNKRKQLQNLFSRRQPDSEFTPTIDRRLLKPMVPREPTNPAYSNRSAYSISPASAEFSTGARSAVRPPTQPYDNGSLPQTHHSPGFNSNWKATHASSWFPEGRTPSPEAERMPSLSSTENLSATRIVKNFSRPRAVVTPDLEDTRSRMTSDTDVSSAVTPVDPLPLTPTFDIPWDQPYTNFSGNLDADNEASYSLSPTATPKGQIAIDDVLLPVVTDTRRSRVEQYPPLRIELSAQRRQRDMEYDQQRVGSRTPGSRNGPPPDSMLPPMPSESAQRSPSGATSPQLRWPSTFSHTTNPRDARRPSVFSTATAPPELRRPSAHTIMTNPLEQRRPSAFSIATLPPEPRRPFAFSTTTTPSEQRRPSAFSTTAIPAETRRPSAPTIITTTTATTVTTTNISNTAAEPRRPSNFSARPSTARSRATENHITSLTTPRKRGESDAASITPSIMSARWRMSPKERLGLGGKLHTSDERPWDLPSLCGGDQEAENDGRSMFSRKTAKLSLWKFGRKKYGMF